ncbi:hypothetical protein DFJ74DRAFT_635692 [Hyaloraphidium curvatum]|nr:hypothetical protein DFJ74DRAFT_635692 [Hyaloraphidium curvatum]
MDIPEKAEAVARDAAAAASRHSRALWFKFNNPRGPHSRRARTFDVVAGRIGWTAKGVVYAILGGITIRSGLGDPASAGHGSPVGAFLLVGDAGEPLLVILGIGLLLYAFWRYFECVVGAGYDTEKGAVGNFFKFRLSPFVYNLLHLLLPLFSHPTASTSSSGAPCSGLDCWAQTTAGRAGLAIVGLGFLCAFLSQLVPALTGSFKRDLDPNKIAPRRWERMAVYVLGQAGILARAVVFMACAVLFFKAAEGVPASAGLNGSNYIGSGLEQFKTTGFGRFCMVFLGLGLILYGTYAVVAGLWYKLFPTEPPSRVKAMRRSMGLERNEAEAESKIAGWKRRFWPGGKGAAAPSSIQPTQPTVAVSQVKISNFDRSCTYSCESMFRITGPVGSSLV